MGAEESIDQAAPGHEAAGPLDSPRNRRANTDMAPARIHAERQHQKLVREKRLRSLGIELLERDPLVALAAVQEDPAKRLIFVASLVPKALGLQCRLIRPAAGDLGSVRPGARDPGPHRAAAQMR